LKFRTQCLPRGLRGDVVLDRRLERGRSGDKHLAVRAVPGRDLMAPPQLARDAPGLDVLHPLEIGLFPVLRHEHRVALAHAFNRRLGQLLALTYHWSVSNGSIGTPPRSPCGTMWVCGSIMVEQPFSSILDHDRLRAANRSSRELLDPDRACPRGPSALEEIVIVLERHARRRQDVDRHQPRSCRLPTSKSLKSCAGVILTAPEPAPGRHTRRHDRDAPADQRQDRTCLPIRSL
jgi:hypothetical protein